MPMHGQVERQEWEFIKEGEYSPEDYDIPKIPVAPDVSPDHPEHLSAENTMDLKP